MHDVIERTMGSQAEEERRQYGRKAMYMKALIICKMLMRFYIRFLINFSQNLFYKKRKNLIAFKLIYIKPFIGQKFEFSSVVFLKVYSGQFSLLFLLPDNGEKTKSADPALILILCENFHASHTLSEHILLSIK